MKFIVNSTALLKELQKLNSVISSNNTLPILSIAVDSVYFWDEEVGIHLVGINGNYGCDGTWSNYNQDWERPISLEYYATNGVLGFKINAGVKIFGGCSRAHEQKSLAIYTKKYDSETIYYQIFGDKPINEFKSFVLRNSGSDWSHTPHYNNNGSMMRDAMMQSLVKNRMDIDYQAYQPSIIYINGKYWGILNIREKLNGDYLAANHNIDPDNVDILKRNITIYAGDANHFYSILNFIESNGVVLDSNYDHIKTQIDIDEYINYQISQIYFGNQDWPWNNIKYWRPRTNNGKWRWILYDTDSGFNLNDPNGFSHNTLEIASSWNGDPNCIFLQNCGENDDMEKYLFYKLLENNDFKNKFINRMAYHLNTSFKSTRVIDIVDSLSSIINQEMHKHINRWGDAITYDSWQSNLDIIREFANQRVPEIQQHILEKFKKGKNEL